MRTLPSPPTQYRQSFGCGGRSHLLGFAVLRFGPSVVRVRLDPLRAARGAGPSVVVSGAAIRGDATGEHRRRRARSAVALPAERHAHRRPTDATRCRPPRGGGGPRRLPRARGRESRRVARARSCCCGARTVPARPRCCGCAPGWCRSPAGPRTWSGTTWPPSVKPFVAGSGCSDTRTGSTATSRSPRTSASGDRRSAPPRPRSPRRWRGSASTDGSATWPSASCRPGSAAAPRSPAWWRGGPNCGCSTSRTPASTRRPVTSSTTRCARPPSAGATIIVASHELERAGSLATRWVDVVAGQAREAAP